MWAMWPMCERSEERSEVSERTVHEAHPPLPYPNSEPTGVGHRRFFVCGAMQCSLEDGVAGVGNNGCVEVGLCGFERR